MNAGEIVADLSLKVDGFKQGMDDAKQELGGFSDRTKKVAGAAGAALAGIGTVAAGVGGAALKMAADQEQAMSRMEAATGSTKQEMAEFQKIADNLFGEGLANYDQIYSSLTNIKQTLGQTGKAAEETAKKALEMSQAFGWETSESIKAADTVMQNFDVSSEKAFDNFAALAQQAGDKSGDLLESMNEYAPVMSDAGISLETFAGALKSGMNAGAFNFDKIGDSLKEFNVRLKDGTAQENKFVQGMFDSAEASSKFFKGIADGSIKGNEALQTITSKLTKVEDKQKQARAGTALFGTMWEDLGAEAVLSMGQAEGALNNVKGASDRVGESLEDNVNRKVKKIKNQFLLWAKDMGEQLLPELNKLLDWVINNMPQIKSTMTAVFTSIGKVVKTTASILGSIISFVWENRTAFMALAGVLTAAVMPAMLGFIAQAVAVRTKALIALITSTARLISFNYALGISYLAAYAPMIAIVAAVGAVVAAIALLITNSDVVMNKLNQLGLNVKGLAKFLDKAKTKFNQLKDALMASETFQTIISIMKEVSKPFADLGKAIANVFKTGDFQPLLQAVKNLLPTILGFLLGGIPRLLLLGGQLVQKIAEGMGLTVPQLLNKVTNMIIQMLNRFLTMLPKIIQMGVTILTNLINGIVRSLPKIMNAILKVVNTLVQTLTTLLPKIIKAGIKILTTLIDGIVQMLPKLIQMVIKLINRIVQMVIKLLPKIIQAGIEILMALIDGILQILPQLIQAAIKLITSILNALLTNLPKIIDAGVEILFALIDGIVKILPQLIGAAIRLITTLFTTLIDNLPTIIDAGIDLIMALIDGLIQTIPQLVGAVPKIVDAIFDAFADVDWLDIGKDIIEGIGQGLKDFGGSLIEKGKEVASNALGGIQSFLGIASPSKVFRDEVGAEMMNGIMVGVERLKRKPLQSVTKVAEGMIQGTDNIKRAMQGISGMQVAPPQIGNLTSGQVNVEQAFNAEGGNGQGGTNYNAPLVNVDRMEVRDDQDVRSVSRELFSLQRNHDRAGGR